MQAAHEPVVFGDKCEFLRALSPAHYACSKAHRRVINHPDGHSMPAADALITLLLQIPPMGQRVHQVSLQAYSWAPFCSSASRKTFNYRLVSAFLHLISFFFNKEKKTVALGVLLIKFTFLKD